MDGIQLLSQLNACNNRGAKAAAAEQSPWQVAPQPDGRDWSQRTTPPPRTGDPPQIVTQSPTGPQIGTTIHRGPSARHPPRGRPQPSRPWPPTAAIPQPHSTSRDSSALNKQGLPGPPPSQNPSISISQIMSSAHYYLICTRGTCSACPWGPVPIPAGPPRPNSPPPPTRTHPTQKNCPQDQTPHQDHHEDEGHQQALPPSRPR